jgi:hypothetical protein
MLLLLELLVVVVPGVTTWARTAWAAGEARADCLDCGELDDEGRWVAWGAGWAAGGWPWQVLSYTGVQQQLGVMHNGPTARCMAGQQPEMG